MVLGESGLRPGEVFSLKLNDLNLNTRISELRVSGLDVEDRAAAPLKFNVTKRSFCSFFTSKSLIRDYIEEAKIQPNQRLFYNRRRLREEIYKAMMRILGRTFDLYALRRFFVTEMLRRDVNPLFLDMMQGRKPKAFRIMLGHYQKLTLFDLRREYDKAQLRVI